MFVYTLVTLTLFANQYNCMRNLDMDIVNRPEHSTFKYIGKTTVLLSLYEANAILRCEDNKYTIHVLEEGELSDFNL